MALADVIVNAAEVPASQTDFMVEVKQGDLPASFLLNNGDDIRAFRNGGTTQVPCHAAGFSSGAGKLFIFLTGLLSAIDDTPIRISADGTSPAPPVDSTYGRNNVWPTHVTANHLYGDGTDYSGNGNDLVASVPGTVVFNADHVAISAGGWLETAANLSGADFTDAYAIQFLWDNPASQAFAARQFSASAGGNSGLQLSENMLIRHNTNNQTVSTAGLYGGGLKGIDVTWENATNGLATYVAGAPEGSGTSFQTPNAGGANSAPLYVYSYGDSFRALEGDLYSFRWDRRLHDAPWVATEDSNRNSATFYTVTEIPEGTDIIATLESLFLTSRPAAVGLAVDVAAGVQALEVSTPAAMVGLATDILAGTEALQQTAQPATVSLSQAVQAIAERINILARPASILLGSDVQATLERINLAANGASVVLDVSIAATPETLLLTARRAVVAVGQDVRAVPELLTLTARGATLVLDVDVLATLEAIALETYRADIGGGVVAPDAPGLEFTIPDGRTHFAAEDGRVHYTLPVSRIHFTITED